MSFSIEMSNHVPTAKYGVIHKAGCRDLRDEMPLGEATDMASLQALTEEWVCWADGDDEYRYETAPCVRFPKASA